MFYEGLKTGSFDCYLKPNTRLPMIYIDDALRAFWEFMTTPNELLHRRVYNVTAMSFSPQELEEAMRPYVPDLKVTYHPDSRQEIGV